MSFITFLSILATNYCTKGALQVYKNQIQIISLLLRSSYYIFQGTDMSPFWIFLFKNHLSRVKFILYFQIWFSREFLLIIKLYRCWTFLNIFRVSSFCLFMITLLRFNFSCTFPVFIFFFLLLVLFPFF